MSRFITGCLVMNSKVYCYILKIFLNLLSYVFLNLLKFSWQFCFSGNIHFPSNQIFISNKVLQENIFIFCINVILIINTSKISQPHWQGHAHHMKIKVFKKKRTVQHFVAFNIFNFSTFQLN